MENGGVGHNGACAAFRFPAHPTRPRQTAIMNADPTIVDDVVKGELRPFRVSLLDRRDS